MNLLTLIASVATALTLTFTLSSCSNIGEKRTALAAAGFKTVPATTPAQIAHLKTLKPGKVIALQGKKGVRYVFPDPAKNCLMVGTASQFQQYRAIKLKQQQVDEKLLDAQMNMDTADWNTWSNGESGAMGWSVASDPL
jgi:hypothetical protein